MATSTKTKRASSRLDDARARMYRDLVFESAECVFGQKGFEHSTMQEVASEAGISLKTLYSVFPGKQELYEEIQRVRGRAFVGHVADAIDAEGSPVERLEQMVGAYVGFVFAHRHWFGIQLHSPISWGIRPKQEFAVGYWEEGLGTLAAILRDGQSSSVFHPGDPLSTAALVQSVLQTLVAQAVSQDEEDGDETTAEILVQLRRLLCRVPAPALGE